MSDYTEKEVVKSTSERFCSRSTSPEVECILKLKTKYDNLSHFLPISK